MGGFSSVSPEWEGYTLVASDIVQKAIVGETNRYEATYTLAAALKVPDTLVSGTARVRFTLASLVGGGNAYGRIYKNGVAIGIERMEPTSSYATFSEDLNIGSGGDVIELYMHKTSGPGCASTNNFSIRGTLTNRIDRSWKQSYP